jgi:hypothetical protein
MEQRRDARYEGGQMVAVTLLGEQETRIEGRIRNISGRGLGLEVGQSVGIGTALKVEIPDSILLGEVMYCRQDPAGYYLGVQLEHALYGLMALSASIEELTGKTSRPEQADATQEARRQD